jgi:hypothetical protein
MIGFKANQVQEAIFRTLGADGKRADEIRFRLQRLRAADRNLGRRLRSPNELDRVYAFYGDDPPGTGVDIQFTSYEAFALLAAIMLLEHGLPQATVVKLMRQMRSELQLAHAQTLEKDPSELFDQNAIRVHAKSGMIAFDSTVPVILVFLKLTGSSADNQSTGTVVSICRNNHELAQFIKRYRSPGIGFSIFEFSRLIHLLQENLSHTPTVKRGRWRSPPSARGRIAAR